MKLQYLIDQLLSTEIKAEPYVDRYGGVTQVLIKQTRKDGKTISQKYPVACDVTSKDCNNAEHLYHNLVPDDSKNSVVYWEVVTPMRDVGPTSLKKFNTRKFQGTARLVVWLNLAALGDTCKDAFLAIPPLEKILTKNLKITSGAYQDSLIRIRPKAMVPHDINAVFGKYDYNKHVPFYLYPYDYFAIDVVFELDQCLSKGGVFPINPSIDCPNDTGITRCEDILATMDVSTRCCVLKGYNFESGYDVDFDCFSGTQITDLAPRFAAAPPISKSTAFDGINEEIRSPYSSFHELERTDLFAMNGWVEVPSVGTTRTIMGKFDFNGIRRGWYAQVNFAGQIRFGLVSNESISNSIIIQTIATIPLGSWVNWHINYTGGSDESSFSIYINKVLAPHTFLINNLSATTVDATNDLCFGFTTAGTNFLGSQYNNKIWKGLTLTTSEIDSLGTPATMNNSIQEANLVMGNDMGGGSIYGTDTPVYPDITNNVSGFQGFFIESGDITTNIPV